jgi:hypothetical protein
MNAEVRKLRLKMTKSGEKRVGIKVEMAHYSTKSTPETAQKLQ